MRTLLVVSGVLFAVWLLTKSNLPSCGSASLNYTGECIARPSDIHVYALPAAVVCLVIALAGLLWPKRDDG
jgi:hypothetical protein